MTVNTFKTFIHFLILIEITCQSRRLSLHADAVGDSDLRILENVCPNFPFQRNQNGNCLERGVISDDSSWRTRTRNLNPTYYYHRLENPNEKELFPKRRENFKKFEQRIAVPSSVLPETISRNISTNQNITAAIIEGTGPIYCGLRGSSELNSGIRSIFTRDIGFYRCYFHGGAQLLKIAVLGTGFYQCFFQRPGTKLVVRQGIGMYFCFFQGIRHTHGFMQLKLQVPKELNNFLYIFGSVNYALRPDPANSGIQPLAQGQLVGMYNFGPEGSDHNFGLLQASESINLKLPPLPFISDNSTISQVKKQSNSETYLNQMGLYQYHYNGADFNEGRANRFGSFAYNFQREFDVHAFAAQLFLFELSGQGQQPIDDRDFAQIWLTYKYTVTPKTLIAIPSYFQAFLVGQYNYLDYESSNYRRSHGLDFVQLILLYTETFPGVRERDTFTLNANCIFQSNLDVGPNYLVQPGQDSPGLVEDSLIISILQLTYNFFGQNGSVTGLIHFHAMNQFYLDQVSEEPPGYFQLVLFYIKTYKPFQNANHAAVWSLTSLLEYVVGAQELSNAAISLQAQIVIDTTALFDEELTLSNTLEVNAKPSTVTIIALFQCISYGIQRFRPVCFYQIYLFYIGSITGISPVQGSGQSVLLAQFYQDVRV